MKSKSTKIVLPGSERKPLGEAKARGAADPNRVIEVTVRLRSKAPSAQELMKMGAELPAKRKYLSPGEFSLQHGADPADVAKVEAFAQQHGLTVMRSSLTQRTVRVAGTVAALSAAFGVKLQMFRARDLSYRGRTGPIYIRKELKNIVEGVHGLDNRPVARPHFRLRPASTGV